MSSSPVQMLADYVRAFESQRAEEVVPFYLLPCTFIRPDGTWVVQDAETALVLVRHMMDHALSQGYRTTATSRLVRRDLAANLVELAGDFERFDAQGEPIARFGFTYILREVSGAWRIQVAIAHEPGAEAGPP